MDWQTLNTVLCYVRTFFHIAFQNTEDGCIQSNVTSNPEWCEIPASSLVLREEPKLWASYPDDGSQAVSEIEVAVRGKDCCLL